MHGINSVRRTSENITRQSLKAIEGLSSQSEMLKSVSENLLSQIGTVTNRFEGQGQAIMKAANSLESANYKIDATLQGRHAELSQTIDRLSGKADEFGRFVEGYSSSIEGSISEAEARARATAEELRKSSELAKMSALKDLERFRGRDRRRRRPGAGRLEAALLLDLECRQRAAHVADEPFRPDIRGGAPARGPRRGRDRRRAGTPARADGPAAGCDARECGSHARARCRISFVPSNSSRTSRRERSKTAMCRCR